MISGHDWRNSEIYVTCLPVELVPQLPSSREHRDHVTADDAVITGNASKYHSQVTKGDITEVVDN
jgi:hypothetical protein